MTLLKPLDVAIGLVFLFLLVTFLASALVEILSTLRNWRAEMLYGAIKNMLPGDLVSIDAIYGDPVIIALGRDDTAKSWMDLFEPFGWRAPNSEKPQPSYIPAGVFSGSILQALAPGQLTPDATVQAIQAKLQEALPEGATPGALRSVIVTALATQGASVQSVKLAIEKWFNDTMDRASGWYKRRTQSALLLVGLAMALLGNIDAIAVSLWLWKDDPARQAIVAAATDYAKKLPEKPATGLNGKELGVPQKLEDFGKQLIATDNALASLQYPIGWSFKPDTFAFCWHWLVQYLVGCLIVAVAVSMGSSFWFDALQSLLKMRSTGPKPGAR